MTLFLPGPWEVELVYFDLSVEHKARYNCDVTAVGAVGDPFSAFSAERRSGVNAALNILVDEWVALLRPWMAVTANFTIANLYKYTPGALEKTFYATYDVNLLGTGGGAAQASHQSMLTFTTQLGNNMKIQMMDDISTANVRIPIRDAVATYLNTANYLVGTTNWIKARDGSYPIGKLNFVGGQNEALFKKRNR